MLTITSWDGGGGDFLWSNALNWSGNVLPGSADVAQLGAIAPGHAILITDDVPADARTLSGINSLAPLIIDAGVNLRVTGDAVMTGPNATVTIDGGSITGGHWSIQAGILATENGGIISGAAINGRISLAVAGAAIALNNATTFDSVTISGSNASLLLSANTPVTGEISVTSPSNVSIALTQNGTLTIAPTGGIRLTAAAGGLVRIGGAGTTLLNLGYLTDESVNGAFDLRVSAISNQGLLDAAAGEFTIPAATAVTNFASGVLTGGTWQTRATGSLGTSFGYITVNAATIRLTGAGTWSPLLLLTENRGELLLDARMNVAAFPQGGTLTNSGTITVGPGSVLAIVGGLVQTSNGVIRTRINAANYDIGIGGVSVSGAANLAGTLRIDFDPGFAPPLSFVFPIVQAGSVSGRFAATQRPVVPPGMSYSVTYTSTSVSLSIEPLIGAWIGLGDGFSWNDGGNWYRGIIPGPTDTAVITPTRSFILRVLPGDFQIGTIYSTVPVVVQGNLQIGTRESFIDADLQVQSGRLILMSGATLEVTGAFVLAAAAQIDGDLILNNNSPSVIANSAQLRGSGTIDSRAGLLDVNAAATQTLAVIVGPQAVVSFSADQQLRSLTVDGVVDIGAASVFAADSLVISGYGLLRADIESSEDFGAVYTRRASVGGSLEVYSLSGFDPSRGVAGFKADIIAADELFGEFSDLMLPPTAAGALVVRYADAGVRVLMNIADFNSDGAVDGNDIPEFYYSWAAGENTADVNEDGGIDGIDLDAFFALWESGGR